MVMKIDGVLKHDHLFITMEMRAANHSFHPLLIGWHICWNEDEFHYWWLRSTSECRMRVKLCERDKSKNLLNCFLHSAPFRKLQVQLQWYLSFFFKTTLNPSSQHLRITKALLLVKVMHPKIEVFRPLMARTRCSNIHLRYRSPTFPHVSITSFSWEKICLWNILQTCYDIFVTITMSIIVYYSLTCNNVQVVMQILSQNKDFFAKFRNSSVIPCNTIVALLVVADKL